MEPQSFDRKQLTRLFGNLREDEGRGRRWRRVWVLRQTCHRKRGASGEKRFDAGLLITVFIVESVFRFERNRRIHVEHVYSHGRLMREQQYVCFSCSDQSKEISRDIDGIYAALNSSVFAPAEMREEIDRTERM